MRGGRVWSTHRWQIQQCVSSANTCALSRSYLGPLADQRLTLNANVVRTQAHHSNHMQNVAPDTQLVEGPSRDRPSSPVAQPLELGLGTFGAATLTGQLGLERLDLSAEDLARLGHLGL